MFKQILTTVCIAAIMSTGSVAYANDALIPIDDTAKPVVTSGQDNDQNQGSLSNQSNVGNNSNSNSSNNTTVTENGTYKVDSTSNSNNTSTSIANQNGYVASVPIIASAGTCLGSTGTTLSAAGIGIGSSNTVVDDACNERQQQQLDSNVKAQEAVTRANNVRLLNELGLAPSALSLLCQDPSIRLALKAGIEPVLYNKVCAPYDIEVNNLTSISLY